MTCQNKTKYAKWTDTLQPCGLISKDFIRRKTQIDEFNLYNTLKYPETLTTM
jgi:hypothetical protein